MLSDFIDIIREITSFYQRSMPKEETIRLWNRSLEGMNLRAAHAKILDTLTNGEAFPRNLPAAIRGAYSGWLKEQPREREERGCPKCLGGMIFGRDQSGYSYAFNCGHCNAGPEALPIKTRYALASQGYKLDWTHDFDGPTDPYRKKKIEAAAMGRGGDTPF